MSMKLHGIIFDTRDPDGLARFYEQLLSMTRVQDESDWVVIGTGPEDVGLAFQSAPDHVAPTWPDPEVPQQIHLDVRVDDLAAEHERAIALGAKIPHRIERQLPGLRRSLGPPVLPRGVLSTRRVSASGRVDQQGLPGRRVEQVRSRTFGVGPPGQSYVLVGRVVHGQEPGVFPRLEVLCPG